LDENDDGECTVLLTDRPDYPDSEPHLAFKQAQARKRLSYQQQKDKEDRIAGKNALTREEELELRVLELTKTLEKYQADAVVNSTKDRELKARVFKAESQREATEETLSTFKERQRKFRDDANRRLELFANQKKALKAEKQKAASRYGVTLVENQSLKTEIASLRAENQSVKAETVRLNGEIASLRNKDVGRNFTGAWDDDGEVV
jgi:chromosome segregation ATPase